MDEIGLSFDPAVRASEFAAWKASLLGGHVIDRFADARRHIEQGHACEGISASWCPVCGDCLCPEDEEEGGYPDGRNDPTCPLHAPASPHATGRLVDDPGTVHS